MNRLQEEWRRLYLADALSSFAPGSPDAGKASADALVDAKGRTRAMVLQLARPPSWSEVSPLWRAVQVDLDLPAPAIAITGVDALQLWFSLREPVPVQRATGFLQALCRHHLSGIRPDRLALFPDASRPGGLQAELPPAQVRPECWSAFVAPGLAPLFDDQPWLDHPPGVDAQADLLSRIEGTSADAFERACQRLEDGEQALRANAQAKKNTTPDVDADVRTRPEGDGHKDAAQFLLGVMNDPAVELHLRIEAAKALLPHTTRRT